MRSQLFPEDNSDDVFAEKFPEDTSSSEESEDNSKPKVCMFQGLKLCKCNRAISPIEISSDEELEKSMVQLEQQISLEMSESD